MFLVFAFNLARLVYFDKLHHHNNDGERALHTMAAIRKIPYGNRSEKGMRVTETMCAVYTTCEMHGVSFCSFEVYLDGKVISTPMPVQRVGAAAA